MPRPGGFPSCAQPSGQNRGPRFRSGRLQTLSMLVEKAPRRRGPPRCRKCSGTSRQRLGLWRFLRVSCAAYCPRRPPLFFQHNGRGLAALSNPMASSSHGRILPVLTVIFRHRLVLRSGAFMLSSTAAPDTDLRIVSWDGASGSLQYLHPHCLLRRHRRLRLPAWPHTHPRRSRARARAPARPALRRSSSGRTRRPGRGRSWGAAAHAVRPVRDGDVAAAFGAETLHAERACPYSRLPVMRGLKAAPPAPARMPLLKTCGAARQAAGREPAIARFASKSPASATGRMR